MEKEALMTRLDELLDENEEELTAETLGKLVQMVFTLKSQQIHHTEKKNIVVKNKKKKKKLRLGKMWKNFGKKKNAIPKQFKCPISKKLMENPVILSSGQTYDRSSLVNWESSKNKKSPRSKKDLSHETVTPNHAVRELILKWCKSHGVQEPVQRMEDPQPTDFDDNLLRDTLVSMFDRHNLQKQILAVERMLRLLRERPVFQTLIADDPTVLPEMLLMISPPPTSGYQLDPEMHKNMITLLLHLSTDQRNRQELSKCEKIIPVLIKALNAENKLKMRCDAAATTYQLSLIDENKEIIGKSNVLKLLIELLKEKWSPQANQDAMDAILSLCENEENLLLAVKLGVLPVIANKIVDGTFVDELLPMLKFFSGCKQAVVMMVNSDDCLLPVLLSVARENPSDVSRENAVSILSNVIEQYPVFWAGIVKEIEQNRGLITQISQNGTPDAKIMANEILESLK